MQLNREHLTHLIEDDLDARNENWTTIEQKTNELINYIGELSDLSTEEKSNLVGAINEITDGFASHLADIAQTQVAVVNPSGISGAVNYYKSFGVVNISITHSTLSQELASFSTLELFTLPVGFRPATVVWFPLTFDNGAASAVLQISSTGVVSIYARQFNAIATNIAFRGSAVFPVKQ